MKKLFQYLCVGVLLAVLAGCTTCGLERKELYPAPVTEAQWIVNGQPLEYEKTLWYPADIVENLLDDEVYLLGEYRGVQIFAEKTDVRPYERIYTKFGKHKYRAFEKKQVNDKG